MGFLTIELPRGGGLGVVIAFPPVVVAGLEPSVVGGWRLTTHPAQSSGSRENSSSGAWSSRENRLYKRSRLSIQASSSWAVKGSQGQIVIENDQETLTLWLRSRGAGDRNAQGADGESPDGEEGESSFEEHGGMLREEE